MRGLYKSLSLCVLSTLLSALLAACATGPTSGSVAAGSDKPWVTLFDASSNLNDYTLVGNANWRIEGGVLHADLLKSATPSYLVTKKSYANTEIYVEMWVDGKSNSGIFVRCQDPKVIGADTCYEFNIWDARPDPSYGTGAIVDVVKVDPMPRAGSQWNTLELTLKGDELVFKLNGVVSSQAKHSKLAKGHIGLQYGSGVVKFRKVMIREL